MKRPNVPAPARSEITPRERYFSRREIMAGLVGTGLSAWAGQAPAAERLKFTKNARLSLDEPPNSAEEITTYNNFYEFGTDKGDPARLAPKFRPRPWT